MSDLGDGAPRRLCPDCDGTGTDVIESIGTFDDGHGGESTRAMKVECPQCKGRGAQVWRPSQQIWQASPKRDTDRFDNGDST